MVVENLEFKVTQSGNAPNIGGKISGGTDKAAKSMKGLSKSTALATGKVSKLASQLKRIAVYRMLSIAMKQISGAFTEGLENAYQFSKQISGPISQALDQLSSGSLKMKNALGAAFGELIASVTPMLIQLMNLAIRVANVLSQLFAILGGRSTWQKATDVATDWGEAASGAAGATAEWKNQLMGFDEINKLEDQSSSGGGGSGSGVDYSDMFEMAEISPKIKEFIQWCEDHINLIKAALIAIAGLMLGTKIAKLLSSLSTFATGLKGALGIILAIAGGALLVYGFIDAWVNGIDWSNLLTMLSGAGLLTLGLWMAFGKVGAAVGLLISGIALVVTGLKEWISTGKLSLQGFTAIAAGILAIGAAIAILVGGWIPLLVAAIAAAVVGIVALITNNWDSIKTWFENAFNSISDAIGGVLDKIKLHVANRIISITAPILAVFTTIKDAVTSIGAHVMSKVNAISAVVAPVFYAVKEAWTSVVTTIISGVQKAYDAIVGILPAIGNAVKSVFENITIMILNFKIVESNFAEITRSLFTSVVDFIGSGIESLSNKLSSFFNWLPNTVANIGNNIVSAVRTFINNIIAAVQSAISAIQNLLSFSSSVSVSSKTSKVKKFASGGTPATGSLFVAGESGAEIISSASGRTSVSNTDQIANSVSIGNEGMISAVYSMANAIVSAINNKDTDITLDGMTLARNLYKYNQQASREHGNALISYSYT